MGQFDDHHYYRQTIPSPATVRNAKRIGDPEKVTYSAHLNDMYSKGYLTLEEFTERMSSVQEAKYSDQLALTVEDLPSMFIPDPTPPKPVVRKPAWPVRAWTSTPPLLMWIIGWMFALSIAVTPGITLSTTYGGFGHIPGPMLAVVIVSIIVGAIGSLTGFVGTVIAVVDEF